MLEQNGISVIQVNDCALGAMGRMCEQIADRTKAVLELQADSQSFGRFESMKDFGKRLMSTKLEYFLRHRTPPNLGITVSMWTMCNLEIKVNRGNAPRVPPKSFSGGSPRPVVRSLRIPLSGVFVTIDVIACNAKTAQSAPDADSVIAAPVSEAHSKGTAQMRRLG